MTGFRQTFDLIEAAAENRGDLAAKSALRWISDTINAAFSLNEEAKQKRKLDGADPCERVAEALAVWLKESDLAAFYAMTGTRYAVTSLDCSADGMERLRDQSEFILLAYPGAGSTADEVGREWLSDIGRVERGDGFDYDAAESAVRGWISENVARIEAELKALATVEPLPESDPFPDDANPAFRLYVFDKLGE